MRALYLWTANSSVKWLTPYLVRQGLEPIVDATIPRPYNGSATTNYSQKLIRSFDSTKGIGYRYTGSNDIAYYYQDILDASNVSPISVLWSGAIYDAFCGNNYYGFVGTGSQILMFEWTTHTVITLNKTGLGTINSCSLNKEETKLAVAHSTAPYLRVYDIASGTYVDAVTSAVHTAPLCCWTYDSQSLIVTTSTSSAAVSKYSADLSTKVVLSTSSNHVSTGTSNGTKSTLIWNKDKPSCVLVAGMGNSASTGSKLISIDVADNTIVDLIPRTPQSNSTFISGMVIDYEEKKLYAMGNYSPASPPLDSSSMCFNSITYERLAQFPNFGFYNNYSDTTATPTLELFSVDYGILTGTIRDIDNNPAARKIRAFRRTDGLIVAETTSNPTTGDYRLILPTNEVEAYDIQFMSESGEILNDLFFARATAQSA